MISPLKFNFVVFSFARLDSPGPWRMIISDPVCVCVHGEIALKQCNDLSLLPPFCISPGTKVRATFLTRQTAAAHLPKVSVSFPSKEVEKKLRRQWTLLLVLDSLLLVRNNNSARWMQVANCTEIG